MIRQVKREDSKRVWQIRNHPKVRQLSNDPKEFSFEEHDPWFKKKYFLGPDNYCYVLLAQEGLVIGYCRIDSDSDNDRYVISIALDPDYHGKGLGTKLLSQSVQMFPEEKEILAEIQKENIISVKLFKKVGFVHLREDEKNYYLKYKPN